MIKRTMHLFFTAYHFEAKKNIGRNPIVDCERKRKLTKMKLMKMKMKITIMKIMKMKITKITKITKIDKW